MSLTGKVNGKTVRGKINRLYELRGYSAYEVAALNGFEGTEEEWLASLKGEKGDKGEAGDCLVVCEHSGEVVAVNDASGYALQGLTIYGKTTQTGTPSPSNPVPLVSAGSGGSIGVKVAGKNLLDVSALRNNGNVTCNVSADTYTVTVTGSNAWGRVGMALGTSLAGKTVCLKMDSATQTSNIAISCVQITAYAPSGNVHCAISKSFLSRSVTIPSDTTAVEIGFYINNTATALDTSNTATFNGVRLTFVEDAEWEQYKEIQTLTLATPNGLPGIPVTSGGNYTDSNGQQWICDEIDLARGVYVQRVYNPVLSALGWSEGNYNDDRDGKLYQVNLNGVARLASGSMVSHFNESASASGYRWETLKLGEYFGPAGYLVVCAPQTTLGEFKDWLASEDAEAMFARETPIETPLDADTLAAYAALHTNKPNTTVLNDAGAGQKLGYVADTKTYIDQKFTQLQSAIIAAIGTI